MNESLIEIIKILAPGIVTALLSATFTVKLAIRRFHEERWWEKKENSYSNLLEVFHRFKSHANKLYFDEWAPSKTLSEEDKQALNEEWKKTNEEYKRLRDLSSFHLSNEAISILDKYDKVVRKRPEPGFDMLKRLEGSYKAACDCLDQLKVAAKKDLKVK